MNTLCPISLGSLGSHPVATATPHESGQLPRSPGSTSQLLPQSFGRCGALAKLPVPGIKQPRLRRQRVVIIAQPGAVEEGRGAGVAGLRLGVGLGAGDQDALEGAVGGVADGEGLCAGGLQTDVAVLLP